MSISREDLGYLLRRGYTNELLAKEVVCSLAAGDHKVGSVEFYTSDPVIAFTVVSMSGEIAGVQTANREKHEYRWFQAPGKAYLPIIYGSDSDYDELYRTGEMMLVEGVFDRIAMKRLLPEMAVFARLSKGVSELLANFIRRYAATIWLAFDNDTAGAQGEEKARKRLAELELRHLSFPTKDPGELYLKYGKDRAEAILRKQMELAL